MNDSLTPRDGELLSAYLVGDLDDDDAAELEARLAREPRLASRLETTRSVIEGLAGLDDVEPPAGFGERLRARLAEEHRAATPAERSAHRPASLVDARARRAERLRQRWPVLGAVAAGVAAFAVLAAVAIVRFDADDVATLAEAPEAAEEPDMEAFDTADEEVAEDALPEPDEAREARARIAEPLVLDTQATLDDADAVRAHLEGTAAETLLGVPLPEADDLAAAFTVAVRRAAPFPNGTDPDACLDEVLAGTEQPVVPAQVEAVRHDGDDALLYVTATARTGSDVLDRLEAWVVEPDGCATRLYVELASG